MEGGAGWREATGRRGGAHLDDVHRTRRLGDQLPMRHTARPHAGELCQILEPVAPILLPHEALAQPFGPIHAHPQTARRLAVVDLLDGHLRHPLDACLHVAQLARLLLPACCPPRVLRHLAVVDGRRAAALDILTQLLLLRSARRLHALHALRRRERLLIPQLLLLYELGVVAPLQVGLEAGLRMQCPDA